MTPWTHRMRGFIDAALSFETLFVLFLFAGRFKAHPWLSWVPVDLTALLFVASVAVGAMTSYRRGLRLWKPGLTLVATMLPLLAWLSLSMLWSPSTRYAGIKVLYSWTLLFCPLVLAALVVAPERRRIRRFFTVLVVVAVLLSLDVLLLARTTGLRNLMFMMGSAYLGMGRAIGLAVVVLWIRASLNRGPSRVAMTALALMLAFTLLVMGGRGPVLSTSVALLTPLLLALVSGSVRRSLGPALRWSALTLLAVVVLIAVALSAGFMPRTIERVESIVQEDGYDSSSAQRLIYYEQAVDHWRDSPLLGKGIGSFPVLIDRGDSPFYPHNLILEILVELGLLGLLFLLLPMAFGLRLLRPVKFGADPERLLVAALFVNTLVNAQVTEDLTGNRLLFVMLGLMAVAGRESERS